MVPQNWFKFIRKDLKNCEKSKIISRREMTTMMVVILK